MTGNLSFFQTSHAVTDDCEQIKLSVLFLLTQQISILIGWSPIPNICHSNCIYHKFLLNEKKLIKINLYKLLSLFCCIC